MPDDQFQMDPRFIAGVDLLGRAGMKNLSIRFQDDDEPVVWIVCVGLRSGGYEAAGALDPVTAMMRLLVEIMDGASTCTHCGKPTAVEPDFTKQTLMEDTFCWYVYDPENETFRRSCEGETTGRQYGMTHDGKVVGRNDPCPCGSGKKWKRCHGA